MTALVWSAILTVSVDQLSKLFILRRLPEGQAVSLAWVAIRPVLNTKPSCLATTPTAWLSLWLVEAIIVVALVASAPMLQTIPIQIALGAVLGGVTGNMLDRVRRAGVVDFIDFGFWPVFNVADTLIVAGVLGAALLLL